MKIYSRAEKLAGGRALHARDMHHARLHRDLGGGLRFNAPGSFVANPVFGMHPSQALQVPPMVGPGGYTKTPNASTPPSAIAMAMQPQPHAQGGAALAHARCLLEGAKRACGGQVDEPSRGVQSFSTITRASGGSVDGPDVQDEAKRLLALWNRTEKANPRFSTDQIFSLMCSKSPGVSRLFRRMLQEGYSRSGIKSMIRGALIRWADGQ
jgi:hypothetical protein